MLLYYEKEKNFRKKTVFLLTSIFLHVVVGTLPIFIDCPGKSASKFCRLNISYVSLGIEIIFPWYYEKQLNKQTKIIPLLFLLLLLS
jgi:hypothetical protein